MRTPRLLSFTAAAAVLVALVFAGCLSSSNAGPVDGGAIAEIDAGDAGLGAPLVSVSSSGASFGTVALGASTSPTTIVITNTGNASTGALTATLGGAEASAFVIDSDTCTGQALAPSATCTVSLHFAPATPGTDTATLTISAIPGGSVTVMITGTAAAPGSLSLTPTTNAFAPTLTGATTAATTFTLTSTGAASDTLTASLTGTDAAQFALQADQCTGKTLAAGGTCTVGVVFSPTAAGGKSATLTIVAAGGTGTASASLTGSGLVPGAPAKLAWAAPSYDAGTTLSTATTTLVLANTGSSAAGTPAFATTGANPTDFVVGATTCDGGVQAGSSCNVTVIFTPKTTAAESATLTATSTPGGMASTTVIGAGELMPGSLAIDHPSNTFTNVVETTTSAPFVFTLSNADPGPTTALSVSIVGGASSPFQIASNTCQGVSLTGTGTAGATCKVGVTFTPPNASLQSDMLKVTAATGGTVTAMLSGTGLTVAALTLTNAAGTSIPFGSYVDGTPSSSLTFTVQNGGQQTSGPVAFNFGGTNHGDFTVGSTNCPTSGTGLAGGGSCTAGVVFTPSIVGGETATLSVTGSPGGTTTPVLTLTGTGYSAGPELQVSPATADFGNVFGPRTPLLLLTVTNVGGGATGAIVDGLAGSSQFIKGADSCSGASLASGAKCLVTLDYNSSTTDAGASSSGTFTVSEPTGTSDSVAVPVSAFESSGTPLSLATAGGMGGPCSTTDAGYIASSIETITVTNTGTTPTGALTVTPGPALRGQFVLVPGGDLCTGVSVAVGSSCSFEVQFQVTTCSSESALVKITSAGGDEVTIGVGSSMG